MTQVVAPRRRGFRGTVGDIYHERTHFDFVGHSRLWFLVSAVAVTISIVALVWSGLNLGIDFEGGTQWELSIASGDAEVSDVRAALEGTAAADGNVLILGDDGVRVQSDELQPQQRAEVTAALVEYAGVERSEISIVDVGPTWGDQITRKAAIALIVFFALIGIYLTFRYEWKMALAAILAVLHDVIVTTGVYAVFGFEVTPETVISFLTILGFSLYDTVVVFDKIEENTPSVGVERGDTYGAMVNRSMNQVLMRSVSTSFVALLPVTSLLVVGSGLLGAVTLRDFALALFIGLLVGTYSSIFVATPLLAWFKEREPRYAAVRERARQQLARTASAPAPSRDALPGHSQLDEVAPPRETREQDAEMPDDTDDARPSTPPAPPVQAAPAASSPPPPEPGGPVTPRARRQRRRKRR
jgi:preprotein translocase subunit SecF